MVSSKVMTFISGHHGHHHYGHHGAHGGHYGHHGNHANGYGHGLYSRNRGYGFEKHYAYDKGKI